MPVDRTRRTTTSRDAAEAAFKAATTKPEELPPKRPTIPNAKELVSLRIDRDIGNPFTVLELGEVQAAAGTLGLELVTLEIRHAQDIVPAFEALKGRSEALLRLCRRAHKHQPDSDQRPGGRRATTDDARVSGLRRNRRSHVLWSKLPGLFGRAADYVDKILRGTKPGNIPVEQPTKFDFIINLTTAKALSLTIPESFLLRANELIE